jgi:hypothetical protein
MADRDRFAFSHRHEFTLLFVTQENAVDLYSVGTVP